MEIKYEELARNGFFIYPDQALLSGVMSVFDGFLAKEIRRVFNPNTIMKAVAGTKEEREKILMPYDGYTWESVFANLKCREIHGFVMTADMDGTNELYLSYLERLHNLDTDRLQESFSGETKEVLGAIYAEIWGQFKNYILNGISDISGIDAIFALAKDAMLNGIQRGISKYEKILQSKGMNDASAIEDMMTKTGDIYAQVVEDPRALFKVNYAAMVKAAEILVCNPEYLPFGERLASAIKYLVGGATICVGKNTQI